MLFRGPGLPHAPRTVRLPSPAGDEALVAIELATVCGSDVHTSLGHRVEPTPLVLGHEAVGRIVALGDPAPRYSDGRPAEVGDRVVWSLAVRCGSCDRCARGIPQKCRSLRKFGHERFQRAWELSGMFATHALLPAGSAIIPVPIDVPSSVLAPAGCGIATARAGLRAAERVVGLDGASVLVTGGGLIGLAACAMASERGAVVTLSDPAPGRRSLGLDFGATRVEDPGDRDPAAEYDVVIDASGAGSALAAGLDALAVGGAAVWIGSVFPSAPLPVAAERVVRGLATITGVHNYAPIDLEDSVAFLRRSWSRFPFAELVGARFPLDDLDSALARAAEQREVRVGVVPG
ncbi:zinc-binding dehydrogenase [Leucobacter sp. CSA2]|uniref:alcohol dehydrogenase n=2 Tax=Leucobacter edaphi TaxID=2796472 RepID=A0A934QCW0_9MICO|nr:zinc-binding dehydrogenase [Leucobacter edaphi]MBK0421888.1 zinc-binding dehydrogenase [Leucobacter edaphi]